MAEFYELLLELHGTLTRFDKISGCYTVGMPGCSFLRYFAKGVVEVMVLIFEIEDFCAGIHVRSPC